MCPPGLFGDEGSPPATKRTPARFTRYARVALERGGAASTLTYGLPDDLTEGQGAIGQRVRVPLARSKNPVDGVIVDVGGPDLLDGFDPDRVRPVSDITGEPLPAGLIDLAKWISSYYACPLGIVLGAMIPGAVKRGTGSRQETRLDLADGARPGALPQGLRLAPTAADAWSRLSPALLPASARDLADTLGLATIAPINRLVRAGLLAESTRRIVRSRGAMTDRLRRPRQGTPPPTPTGEQARAIDAITRGLGAHTVTLLHGITGSGKTEVYLRAIESALDAGSSAIVLVPEISLTPQTSARFLDRFGADTVAVLHSGLTQSERHAQWARARDGGASIVVGARSAVFAPVDNLGLIVVDEEHDGSFKQDQAPRYHARDVAIVRARSASCPVVLGSATPSIESWANAVSGRYALEVLRERPGGACLPRVEIVDVAAERRASRQAWQRSIGPRLEHELRRTLGEGSQAIVLVNRRGFSTYVGCPSAACGWTLGCSSCSVRMVVHKDRSLARGQYVRCHHCHAEQLRPSTCPTCGRKVVALGTGTQRVEEELEQVFGDVDLGDGRRGLRRGETFERVDTDAVRSARALYPLLERFGSGELRVLVGTQMIAKGLDFPGVRLVGVVDADAALAMPDFRASERTFQLISQVAGRAGRVVDATKRPARVIVQTFDPESPAIVLAAAHDYDAFAREELETRRACGLPPAWRLARIVTRHRDAERSRDACQRVADDVRRFEGERVRVVGPAPCVLERLNDQFRFELSLYASDARTLSGVVQDLVGRGIAASDALMAIDVDPVSLL